MNVWMAASDGEVETVKAFLAGGGDVNAQDENGYTPLYVELPTNRRMNDERTDWRALTIWLFLPGRPTLSAKPP